LVGIGLIGSVETSEVEPKSRFTGPRIVVVGGCASGKTTILRALLERGHNAVVCAQEHSEIANLWRRSEPDLLVLLDVDFETVQARRGEHRPRWIYLRQRHRLDAARAAADLVIDTGAFSVQETIDMIERTLKFNSG
jgi:chloramphenicol 3-O-phosphotransferase